MMLHWLKEMLLLLKIDLQMQKSEISLKKDCTRNLRSELYYIPYDNFLLTKSQD